MARQHARHRLHTKTICFTKTRLLQNKYPVEAKRLFLHTQDGQRTVGKPSQMPLCDGSLTLNQRAKRRGGPQNYGDVSNETFIFKMQQHVIEHTKHGHGYKMANAKTHESCIRMPFSCFPRQPRNAPQSEHTKHPIVFFSIFALRRHP